MIPPISVISIVPSFNQSKAIPAIAGVDAEPLAAEIATRKPVSSIRLPLGRIDPSLVSVIIKLKEPSSFSEMGSNDITWSPSVSPVYGYHQPALFSHDSGTQGI